MENIKEKKELNDSEKDLIRIESQIKKIPISQILRHHGVNLVKETGLEKIGYCPFHPDSRPGSFTVNDEKGICQCFSCGKGGNAVRFIELTEDLSKSQAILQLACDEGIISKTEFEIRSDRAYSKEFLKDIPKKNYERKKKKKTSFYLKMANDVYSLFPMIFGLEKDDQEYLLNERKIGEDRLMDYFSIKKFNSTEVVKTILRIYPEYKDELKNLAGFFQMESKFIEKPLVELTMPKGIGILIRNAKGEIVGIQVRKRYIKEGEQRYVWVTSNFARYSKSCSGGATPGAPIDVLHSKIANPEKIAIVEGRFKSEILTQNGFNSLSVQGVGNYVGIEDEINEFPSTPKTAFVFYDADMLHNTAVLNQAIKLGEYLNVKCPGLEIKYCLWHENLGKGIDDLILAGHKNDVRCITQEKLANTFNEVVPDLMNKFGISSNSCKLNKEERDRFNLVLKTVLEKKLL